VSSRALFGSAFAVLGLGLASLSHAAGIGAGADESVLFNSPVMVQNTINYAATTALNVSGAGQLTVTLTDDNFPAFSSLQFALADSNGTLDPLSGAGAQTLDLTQPSTIYVDVFGTTQSGYGLYTIDATFDGVGTAGSAVPVPPSALLLVGGLVMLMLLLRPGAGRFGRSALQAVVTTSVA
jgi:hypothetical protein